MYSGKLLNFKMNRGVVQDFNGFQCKFRISMDLDFNANFLHLLSIGRLTFRSRMSFT